MFKVCAALCFVLHVLHRQWDVRKSCATIISNTVLDLMQDVDHCAKMWLQEPIPATLCHLPGSLGNPLKNSSAMPVAHRNTKSYLATMLANVHNSEQEPSNVHKCNKCNKSTPCSQKQADAPNVHMHSHGLPIVHAVYMLCPADV